MITQCVTVRGIVQGIGYRPFIAENAEKCGLGGMVQNIAGIVRIIVTGEEKKLKEFLQIIKTSMPDGARIDNVEVEKLPFQPFSDFSIVSGQDAKLTGQQGSPLVIPDLPTCPVCSRELFDPNNRRYRYPFISCTACGPRYSILHALPYDRETTTMGQFEMCPACYDEYTKKGNRRRHAQTISCHECGPQLKLGSFEREEALQEAIRIINEGGIVAVKDIGGYHLVCSPFKEQTVAALRLLKEREMKPFAVMFSSVEEVRQYADVDDKEEAAMCLPARPIVLVCKKNDGRKLVDTVCNTSPDIGAMLPCNPLQMLLLSQLGPLIMTSANLSGEPIIIHNDKAEAWIESKRTLPVELGVLSHDREITMPLDDSVMRVVSGKYQIFRRARGFVPEPIWLKETLPNKILAAGGDLKACFCFAADDRAYMSQYLGDLDNVAVEETYCDVMKFMERLFSCHPDTIVTDIHPGYTSTNMMKKMAQRRHLDVVQVQHHHAHVGSVIAEHGLKGTTLGVAYDGTGYGIDGTMWGSEFLLCDKQKMRRVAHLNSIEIPGGDSAAKNADISLCAYILHTKDKSLWEWFVNCGMMEFRSSKTIKEAIRHHINTVHSSSMGRLFDAVSALLDICHYNNYEGQAAIMLEQFAQGADKAYPLELPMKQYEGHVEGDTSVLFVDIIHALLQNADREELAKGFILAVSDYTVSVCKVLRQKEQYEDFLQVALSGGTFQNRMLLEDVEMKLFNAGFKVYRNELVPPGDGGICLGQQYIGQMTIEIEEKK